MKNSHNLKIECNFTASTGDTTAKNETGCKKIGREGDFSPK